MLARRNAAGDELVVQCLATLFEVIGCGNLRQQIGSAQQGTELPFLTAAHVQELGLAVTIGEVHKPGADGRQVGQPHRRKLRTNERGAARHVGAGIRRPGAVPAIPTAAQIARIVKQRAGHPGQSQVGVERPGTGPALFAPCHQARHRQGHIQHVPGIMIACVATVVLGVLTGIQHAKQFTEGVQRRPVAPRPVGVEDRAHFAHHGIRVTQWHLTGDVAALLFGHRTHHESAIVPRLALETVLQ